MVDHTVEFEVGVVHFRCVRASYEFAQIKHLRNLDLRSDFVPRKSAEFEPFKLDCQNSGQPANLPGL